MVRQSFMVSSGAQNPRNPLIKDAFPILRISEISDTFWAMGYPVPREQLEKPTPEFIGRFLEFWIEELLSFSPTDEDQVIDTLLKQPLLQPRESVIAGDQNLDSDRPEMLLDMLPAVRLMVQFKAAKHMMSKLSMGDFTLLDLLRPEPARVVRILSAIINFVRFRDEQVDRWKDSIQEISLAQQKVNNMDVRLTSITNEILRLRSLLEVDPESDNAAESGTGSENPRWQRANHLNDGLRAEVKRLLDLSNVWLEKCKASKAAVTQKYHKIVGLEKLLIDLEDERKRLETYSKMDPADLGKIIEELRSSLRTEEESLKSLEAADKNMTKTAHTIQLLQEDVLKLIKLANSTVEGSRTLEESREQVSRSKEELNNYKHRLERIYVQQQGLERKVELSEERLQKLQESARKQEDEAQKRQADLYSEYEQLASKREQNQADLDAIKLDNDEITAQTDLLKDQYHHEYNEAQDELARLNTLVRDYISEIKAFMA